MNDKIESLLEAAKKYEKQLAGFSGTARHNFAQAPAKAAIDAIPALERLLAGQQQPVAWLDPISGRAVSDAHMNRLGGTREDWLQVYKIPLFSAPPVQEAGREPVAEITSITPTGAVINFEESFKKLPVGTKLYSIHAEPASLGAEAAAREIMDLVADKLAGRPDPKIFENCVAYAAEIIRKHQPIKAAGK